MMDARRYMRLREREGELIAAIRAIQQRARDEAQPYAEELCRLREHRDAPRFKIQCLDGAVSEYEYTGPRPDYKLPEERES